MSDLPLAEEEILDPRLCCPSGACGPVFETSLVELVFRRVRLLAGRRYSTKTVELASAPVLDRVVSTAPSGPPSTARPQEVASHD